MKRVLSLLLALAYGVSGLSGAASALQCEPLVLAERPAAPAPRYGKGLLFKVSRTGTAPSYLFGTMHVGDRDVVSLPGVVTTALSESQSFVMETLLDAAGLVEFSTLMYYQDGTRLDEKVGEELFVRTASLLAKYGIPAEAARRIRPWAAYVTLSLPLSDAALPLDMVLLQRARAQGVPVYGLESIQEQAEALGSMSVEDQTLLLRDTVCHYEAFQGDYAEMKARYLERDLAALAALTNKYRLNDELRYDRLMTALLQSRNHRMVERMAPWLAAGKAFIAIGALHLAGEDGVPALLEKQGYDISPVY